MDQGHGAPRSGAGMGGHLLVSLLALGTVAALFLARSLDDNRLTSWRWVFAGVAPASLHAAAGAGILLALLLSRLPLPPRRPGLILFLLSFAAGACLWGAPEPIVDAARYFTQAKHLEVYGVRHFLAEWGRGIPAWTDLPLVPLLYGLAFRLLGESRLAIQVLATLLFAGTAVVVERLGRALWDGEVGFTAGALLLAIPYLLTQVPSMLVDVPTMALLALALLAVVRALETGGAGRIALASLAVSLALLSKYSAWLLLTVVPVAWLVLRKGAPRAARTGAAIALGSGVLVAAALLPHRHTVAGQMALLVGYQAPGLRRWGESLTSTFLFQVHPFLSAAALAGAWLAVRRRDGRWLVAAWPVLLLAGLRVERIRYWIPAFPMLALLGAYGLQLVGARELRRLALACAVVSSLGIATLGYRPFLETTSATNLQGAGRYLDSLPEERVEVLTPPPRAPEVNPAVSVPILDLFTGKRLVYRYRAIPPPPDVAVSPLRFTWEYRNPGYYAAEDEAAEAAVAVVSDDLGRPWPEPVERRLRGLRLARVFAASEGIFGHQTLVAVYRADSPAPRSPAQRTSWPARTGVPGPREAAAGSAASMRMP